MPYKVSIYVALFLLAFNGGAVMLDASGATGWMGVSPDTCTPSELANIDNNTTQVSQGSGGGETLFGFYNSIARPLEFVVNTIFPGVRMLKCAGVPTWIVNFATTILVIIPPIDLAKFLRSG